MNDLYYEVNMDHDTGREVMVVYDGDTAIDACFSFSELLKNTLLFRAKTLKSLWKG